MNSNLFKKFTIFISLVVLIFFLDRISKIYILQLASKSGDINLYINQFLNLNLVWNKGIAFGLLSFEKSAIYNLITGLIIIINLIILYLAFIYKDIRAYFFIVILGGSLGNVFDRFYYGSVPDFIDINFQGYHWFIFNVSDIFITVGVFCLIIAELLMNKKNI
tara:strand:- start:357 stop:845 length:489 start_codon:yes stop_codon:yes gene_type:complete